ncbi:MAG TPA: hypothetical protein VJN88_05500 [Ktedonobacterales bacterium]|nr:hypothetical protein [Ktedonobacterales bacterium]
MNCPHCGLNLEGITAATCPRCGQPIAVNSNGAPVPPPPPARRRSSRSKVRLVSTLVVIVGLGVLFVRGALGNRVTQSPLPGVTATVTGKWLYRETFTSSTDTMPTGGGCNFADGGYQMQGANCYPGLGGLSNGTVTVQVKQTSGDTQGGYGIVFRRVSMGNNYLFFISGAGTWTAEKCVKTQCAEIGVPGQSQAIQTGLNTVNTLQVHMTGSHFDFLVNGVTVGSADDSTFTSGKVGLGVETGIVCVFNNMEVTI